MNRCITALITHGIAWAERRPLAAATIAIVVGASLLGCTRADSTRVLTYPTRGSITLEGRPLEGAFLVLHPLEHSPPNLPPATAHVQPDGKFSVSTYEEGDGAAAGDYVVTVQWQKLLQENGELVPGPNLLPPKYSQQASSDLIVHVAEGDNTLPSITLRR